MRHFALGVLLGMGFSALQAQEAQPPKLSPLQARPWDLSDLLILRHGATVTAVAFSPDGSLLSAAGLDGRLRFWDARTGYRAVAQAERTHGGPLNAVVFSPDGARIAFAGGERGKAADGEYDVRVEDLRDGRPPLRLKGHLGPVLALTFDSPAGSLASAGADGTIRIWTTAEPAQSRVLATLEKPVIGLALSADRRTLFAAADDGAMRGYGVATGTETRVSESDGPPISAIALSPDGRLIATAGPKGEIRLREVLTGLELARLKVDDVLVPALTFSPDGRLLASGGYDGTLRLWDLEGSAPRQGKIRAWVTSLAWSPDGARIVAGLADGTAAVCSCPPRDAEPAPPAKSEPAGLWAALGERDPTRALAAVREWSAFLRAGSGEERSASLALLKERLSPIAKERLDELIRQLDDDEYEVRVRATGELQRYGAAAGPALRRALEGTPSAEVRQRATMLLKTLGDATITSADVLRTLRAIEVLERAASPEARAILEALAGGADAARETQEARLAIDRLKKPPSR
jgi:WD40 repeat protein